MPHGSCSISQLFLALCVATGLAAACVLLATAEPLTSTPAELRGSSAARRLSRGVNRHSSDRRSTLRRLSGAAKGRRKADGPPPAGITVAYTPEEGYRSQEGQDKWVDQEIFGGKRHGTFVDLGCYDGVTYSNTWYFERKLGWSGVCVEPNPAVFPRIASQAGRASGVLAAVSDHEGTAQFVAAFMRSSLNESAVDYTFLAAQGVATSHVRTKLITPARLLADHLPGVRAIDYVNVDVESLELAILRVWPFESVCVDVFNIENQPPHGEASILRPLQELLEPHGYRHLVRIGVDEVFRRHPPCDGGRWREREPRSRSNRHRRSQ